MQWTTEQARWYQNHPYPAIRPQGTYQIRAGVLEREEQIQLRMDFTQVERQTCSLFASVRIKQQHSSASGQMRPALFDMWKASWARNRPCIKR